MCALAEARRAQPTATVKSPAAKRAVAAGGAGAKDGKVQSYGDHEDSVYSAYLPPLWPSCNLLNLLVYGQ